ncbi:hypothetical protein RE6C_00249 [Rhodopirellula europaea 6C]|uniref:Uncharacterized protein n=1 Tax=Rhodopirellula europaea 6C TaxID=1263867 RepID=M2AA09_9BACT|nr:hypothetical protein RE6C_00249 [Rhodopirellula europaea 6C]
MGSWKADHEIVIGHAVKKVRFRVGHGASSRKPRLTPFSESKVVMSVEAVGSKNLRASPS